MKHSVTKKIKAIIFTAMAILFAVMFTATVILSYNIASSSYLHSALTAANSLAAYVSTDNVPESGTASDETKPFVYDFYMEILNEYAKNVVKTNNVEYLYVVKPDLEKNTLTYIYLIDKNGSNIFSADGYERRERGTVIDYECDEDDKKLLKGELDYSFTHINNEFGNAYICNCPITNEDGTITMFACADVYVDDILSDTMLRTILVGLGILIVLIIFGVMFNLALKRMISKPAKEISTAITNYLVDGRAREPLKIKGEDEFAAIAAAFNTMTDNIDAYVKDISRLTEDKVKSQTELTVAADIQLGILPDKQYSDRYVNVKAFIKPAVYVGGDFYDYFSMKNGKYGFVIADVSGKGVSAAIFMARAFTLIRVLSLASNDTSKILKTANRILEQNNPELYFVTLLLCIYNPKSGELEYSNAGHNICYLLSSDGLKKLDGESGVALGLFDDASYPTYRLKADAPCTLFMYTDGVTEATSCDKKLFGEDRLEAILTSHINSTDDLNEAVYDGIKSFVKDADQSDDITMLTVDLPYTKTVKLQSKVENLTKLNSFIDEIPYAEKQTKENIKLAAEEIFVNICSYAYDGKTGEAEIRIIASKKSAEICFKDSGSPFNPFENEVNIDEYDIETQIGGFGRYITFNLSSDASYRYAYGKNILTLRFDN